MQRLFIFFLLAGIWHKSLQQDEGRNDGEPEYDSDDFPEDPNEGKYYFVKREIFKYIILYQMNQLVGWKLGCTSLLDFNDDGEDAVRDADYDQDGAPKYLMLMPEDLKGMLAIFKFENYHKN